VGWLFGIARNVLLRSYERGRVDARARRRLGMPVLHVDDVALARIEALDDAPALAALATLPDEQRLAIEARVLAEASYAEIAAALETSEQVVRKRVSRGLAALRARMEADG
jgi:RNA polymerase sigma-70 factor (ECF subfamily)